MFNYEAFDNHLLFAYGPQYLSSKLWNSLTTACISHWSFLKFITQQIKLFYLTKAIALKKVAKPLKPLVKDEYYKHLPSKKEKQCKHD